MLPLRRAARNQVLVAYKWGAKDRGLVWALSGTQFDAIIQKPCHYCKLPPSNKAKYQKHGVLVYSGIDRKDNAVGYTPRNVVPCCWFCNKAKKTHSYADFMAWIQRIRQS